MRCPSRVLSACLLAALAPDLRAQLADVAGSRDPSTLKRYEGSTIIGYDFQKFGDYVLVLGPLAAEKGGPQNKLAPSKSQRLEGQTTRILYVVPEERSPLEVLRNYEQELRKGGFQTLYRCARQACGGRRDGWLGEYYLYARDRRLEDTPPKGGKGPPGQVSSYALNGAKDQHYLAAKRTGPPGDAYASVYVATGTFDMHEETAGHPLVLLDLIETAPMESRMVTVDADAMARDVTATGHVALYGIYFDTDKTDLKPESAPTLAEIAKFLEQEPTLTLYVVGHTDNVGGYQYNMGLSERRAAAVVKELTGKYGVRPARLKPAGAGPIAPVAPNDSEEGRAKNRRVELVKQ
ncbi:MAG: OmpA family protein [Gemmatimonadales bacterium]